MSTKNVSLKLITTDKKATFMSRITLIQKLSLEYELHTKTKEYHYAPSYYNILKTVIGLHLHVLITVLNIHQIFSVMYCVFIIFVYKSEFLKTRQRRISFTNRSLDRQSK